MQQTNKKSYKDLERIMKGVSNHRRIQILELLRKEPELSIVEMSDKLDVNIKTLSEHVRRLALSGLVLKRNAGRHVRHKITTLGRNILTFVRMLE